jgi:uncharacterized membrane protein YfcA
LITDPLFYLVAIPAVMLTAIAKSGFGGVAAFAVPLMSLVIAPPQAAAIMLPILCVMDIFSCWAFRGKWDKANLAIMLPGAVVGIGLGSVLFGKLQPDHIRLFIGLIAVVFSLHYWLKPTETTARTPDRLRGTFWGAAAGFTSFLSHTGGPPAYVFLLPQKLDKTTFVGTTVFFFFGVNYLKLIPYASLGLFDFTNLMTAAVLIPLAPFGVWLGLLLHKRVNDKLFYQVCYGALLLVGIKLLYDSSANLF